MPYSAALSNPKTFFDPYIKQGQAQFLDEQDYSEEEEEKFDRSNLARLLEIFDQKYRFDGRKIERQPRLLNKSELWRESQAKGSIREDNFRIPESSNQNANQPNLDQIKSIVRSVMNEIEMEKHRKHDQKVVNTNPGNF